MAGHFPSNNRCILNLSNILKWQWHNLSRCLDLNQLLKSSFYDSCLLFHIVRTTCISTHRYQRSNRTWSTSLTYNWWKSCNNNCRNSSLFNRSLHQYCRAVTGTSSSCEDSCIYAFLFQHCCYCRTCLMFEFFLVSATTHESSMEWSCSLNKSFFY